MYTPPFTISAEAINKIADISRLIERYAIRMEQEDALLLRKANKIKTIHSSLAIEGNTLDEDQVRDIVNGKTVVAPLRQIQEVKNAIATYEQFARLDAFKESDLLRAHGIMMQTLVDDAGLYRKGGVGVFSNSGCVHIAPPADRVPYLMADLFDWLSHSHDHLLVRSCVFHYEFEFIHPFADGNGRMGRLWQSLILSKLHPVFEHLPVENMVSVSYTHLTLPTPARSSTLCYAKYRKFSKRTSVNPYERFLIKFLIKFLINCSRRSPTYRVCHGACISCSQPMAISPPYR